MTTIACNRVEIAADSLASGGPNFSTEKLYQIGDNRFVGIAGNLAEALRFVRWLQEGGPPPEFQAKDDDTVFNAMVLAPDGVTLWDGYMSPMVMKDDNFALGTGSMVALYCMRVLKMSPRKAVEAACEVDDCSAGPVVVGRINRKRVVR